MKYILLIVPLFILISCTNKPIECGDLLQIYAKKIQNIEFIGCKKGKGQTVFQASYSVLGTNSEKVEAILVKKYGIGKLKFTCCGWDSSNGKNGYIESKELKKINQNYMLEILMYGNVERKYEKGNTYLELDKTKVCFYVIVKLLEV
tara:strand:+ start:219 stop:659 length:441 start_codon:yes stop_codon:yes gene_type:complete